MAELMPCPFCGSEAKFVISDHVNSDTTRWHKIMCKDAFGCGAELGDALSGYSPDYEDQVQKLKDKWNRRAVNNGLVSKEAATDVLCDACGNAACPKGLISRCSYYDKMQALPPAAGRLIMLPETVYQHAAERIYESRVRRVIYETDAGFAFDDRAGGTIVFLTREEAEAARKEGTE